MEIKVTHEGETADVRVVNPATGETLSAQHLVAGQSITVTATTITQVSEPTAAAETSSEAPPAPEGTPDGGEGQEPQGEPEGQAPPAEGEPGQPGGAPA